MDRPERAMVVTPHPDDAEIGCGGTIGNWIKGGTEVVYVLCTNGDKGSGDLEMTSDRLAEIREREQAEAAEVLGVKEVVYLRHPDGMLNDTIEFRGELVRAIRKHRPKVVMCPDPFRRGFYLHRDHRVCGQVTLDAVFPFARDHLHFPEHIKEEGLETYKVADVLLWGTEEADTYLDITDTIEAKIESLKKHASQVSADDSGADIGDFIKANAKRMGEKSELIYAEAFRRIHIRG
ncbi:MAG: PIG-L deacetylase family protein [SAR202 cluster bacterium]|nr:PIG-L deacetylase family protein [SAR202 cluster bacterium]MDP6302213.1 PIG-L deacetylase family protein [SAR202 cluster bacterium]MDP7104013.1 PIG-L deacetylase family protein [SAR202 cluster bacterium]MDP7225570.1 PIG-L deacetylase family protein [SAR202 cluster bacterium]MDP7413315.1 PIG-L deacetylase family protein [SAR202 cluster bacterium]